MVEALERYWESLGKKLTRTFTPKLVTKDKAQRIAAKTIAEVLALQNAVAGHSIAASFWARRRTVNPAYRQKKPRACR
jgi:hypothetical protein